MLNLRTKLLSETGKAAKNPSIAPSLSLLLLSGNRFHSSFYIPVLTASQGIYIKKEMATPDVQVFNVSFIFYHSHMLTSYLWIPTSHSSKENWFTLT